MPKHADVIVIGLGAMGAAAAWQLQRGGMNVLGFDRFRPPHAMGSSHGETRITREAVGEGDHLVPLVQRSNAIWRDLEDRTKSVLFDRCGALIIGSAEGSGIHHGRREFVKGTVAAARRFGIAHEVLSPAETRHRFPQFLLQGDELIYYEPGGGMLFPERCIELQLGEAKALGATLRFDEPVHKIAAEGGSVQVHTAAGTYEAGQLVVAAGAWSPGLLPGTLAAVSIARQVLHWLPPDRPQQFDRNHCPVFIWTHGETSEDSIYGFPLAPGLEAGGVKVADEQYTAILPGPDQLQREIAPFETEALFRDHLDGRLSGLGRTALKTAACLYASTDDGQFIVDRLPEAPQVIAVSACSGHGFKHSAGLGELVAAVAAGRVQTPPPGFRAVEPRASLESPGRELMNRSLWDGSGRPR